MMEVIMRIVVVLVVCMLLHSSNAEGGGNYTYLVALLGQRIQDDTPSTSIKYEFVVTNAWTASIPNIKIEGIDGDLHTFSDLAVDATDSHTLPDDAHALNGSEYSNKTLIVSTTEGPFLLQVFVTNEDNTYKEGFLGFPMEKWDRLESGIPVFEYIVATFCATGGFCQFAISALEDETGVSIIFPRSVSEIAFCKGKTTFSSKNETTIELNKFDAVQFETTFDLTGTHIYSYKAIAVFVGSRNVTNNAIVAHTVEQLVPSTQWGKKFAVSTLGTNGYGDVLKIVSNRPDTHVAMYGFPDFTMTDKWFTVVRRIDNGMSTTITASNPIQVMQISGVTLNATETPAISLTYVPPLETALNSSTYKCEGAAGVVGVHIVADAQETLTVTSASNPSSILRLPYERYAISQYEPNGLDIKVEADDRATGILKCDQATMPLTNLYKGPYEPIIEPYTSDPNAVPCTEGGKGKYTFDRANLKGGIPVNPDINQLGPQNSLKVRIRTCGEAVIQFIAANEDAIHMKISNAGVLVTKCPQNGICNTMPFIDTPGNNEANTCGGDMLFYWFRQTHTETLCIGEGPVVDWSATCASALKTIDFSNNLNRVEMSGLFNDAVFHYEIEPKAGCSYYTSEWRCQDRLNNCSMYEDGFCSNSVYDNFAKSQCAKHCGKCFSDSFGREFLVRFPKIADTYCHMYITSLYPETNIGVWQTEGKVLPGSTHTYGIRKYDCYAIGNRYDHFVHIYTDADVSVNVVFGLSTGQMGHSYTAYPVDTYDLQYMIPVSNPTENYEDECYIVSVHLEVGYTLYYSPSATNAGIFVVKEVCTQSSTKTCRIKKLSKQMQGLLFVFERPVTVFCGVRTASTKVYFYQLLPVSSWNTHYAFPALTGSQPFQMELQFLSSVENTIVNVSGGFDATHVLLERGDYKLQQISNNANYLITADAPIAVGVRIYHPTDDKISSFHIIPPLTSFVDNGFFSSVPSAALKDDFDVTEIKSFYTTANSVDSTRSATTTQIAQDFYAFSDTINKPSYGLTILYNALAEWIVIPGYTLNQKVMHKKEQCNTSLATVGDGIDNDCDRNVDEEYCYIKYGVYPEDSDFDGGYSEDCKETLNGPVLAVAPEIPVCFVSNKPAGQCWTTCTCKCSLVDKLEAQKNMTTEQLEASQQDAIDTLSQNLTMDTSGLSQQTAQSVSAGDDRQSAANIGYLGISLFALTFGFVLILDITSLIRDARILIANLKEGFQRFADFICRNRNN